MLGSSFSCFSSSYVELLPTGASGLALQCDYNLHTYPEALQDMVGLYGWYATLLVTPPTSRQRPSELTLHSG